MPSPSTSAAVPRPYIAGALEAFDIMANQQGYAALRVLPVFETQVESGKIPLIPITELLKNIDTAHAPGAGFSRDSFTYSQLPYVCLENGKEEPVSNRVQKMYATMFDAELIAAKRARDSILINMEKRAAALVFNATTFSSYTTGITNEWDDVTNGVPITDVEAAKQSVFDQCGMWPNALVINRKVFNNIRKTAQVIDLAKAQNFMDVRAGSITEQALAAVFDLEQIIVAGSAKNTANYGQSASLSSIWSDEYAMVCKVAKTNDISESCIGRIIHWGENGSTIGGGIESYDEVQTDSSVLRSRMDTDELIIQAETGHLLSNVTT